MSAAAIAASEWSSHESELKSEEVTSEGVYLSGNQTARFPLDCVATSVGERAESRKEQQLKLSTALRKVVPRIEQFSIGQQPLNHAVIELH